MNSSKSHEILAVVLAMCGVLLLGFVYYPLLNPIQYRLTPGPEIVPWLRYSVGTATAALLLAISWYFNSKASQVNRSSHKDS